MDTSKTFKRIQVLPSKTKTVAKAVLKTPATVPVAPEPPGMKEAVFTPEVAPKEIVNPVVCHGVLDTEAHPELLELSSKRLPKLSKDFLLAGRALFTVDNGKGEHYTYKVRAKENEFRGKMMKAFFVSVKASGGRFPYRYIGMLNPTDGTIKCTAKSNFVPGSKEYNVAAWACQSVIKSKMIPTNYRIEHAGKCGRCGRTLTDPESIERGIGPECWTILGH